MLALDFRRMGRAADNFAPLAISIAAMFWEQSAGSAGIMNLMPGGSLASA